MPVVINEFEVVVEPAPAPAANAAAAAASEHEPAPPPIDVEQIERFIAERAARVWAH